MRLHLPGLRLSQGPAQGLRLSLEGTIALPGQPELEVYSWVGLPQQHLEREGAREVVARSSLEPLASPVNLLQCPASNRPLPPTCNNSSWEVGPDACRVSSGPTPRV